MSWEGYERQLESARAIRAEVYDIASALYEREDNIVKWLALSGIMVRRLKVATELLETLRWGIFTGLYGQELEGESDERANRCINRSGY